MSLVISGITFDAFVSRLDLALNNVAGHKVHFRKRDNFMKELFGLPNEHMIAGVFSPQESVSMSASEVLECAEAVLDSFGFMTDWGNFDIDYIEQSMELAVPGLDDVNLTFNVTVNVDEASVLVTYGLTLGDGDGIVNPNTISLQDLSTRAVNEMHWPADVPQELAQEALCNLKNIHKALIAKPGLRGSLGLFDLGAELVPSQEKQCQPFFLPDDLIKKAKLHYDETMTEKNRGVRDPIITPFFFAMKFAGYVEAPMEGMRCSLMRECPSCKNKYSTRHIKNSAYFWGCPHCQTVVVDQKKARHSV